MSKHLIMLHKFRVRILSNNLNKFIPDYVNGGELFTHLYQRDHFTEDQVRIYIGEIIIALEHLHKVYH